MKFDYEKLNSICYDDNHLIWYLKVKSYSLLADDGKYVFFIDKSKVQRDLDFYTNFDMFRILHCLKNGEKIDDILLNIKLKSSLTAEMIFDRLLENNYVESSREVNVKKDISRMNTSELSDLLVKYGFRASFGKRKKLIKKCMDKIPEFAFDSSRFKITAFAEKFLDEYELFNFYHSFLEDFDLIEYYDYVNNSDEELIDSTLNFLDDHIQVAKKEESFGHLDACYSSKSLVHAYVNNYENSINCELKRFILRLNPQYYSYINYYFEYLIFNPLNIDHINTLVDELKIDDIKVLFDEMWDALDLKKYYLSKDLAFDYLEKSLNGDDLDELSGEFQNKYIDTAEEFFNLSLDYYNNHDYLTAQNFFDDAFELNQSISEALYYEALSYIHFKDYEWAEIRIDEALEIQNDDGRYWSVKGIISYETNNVDNAIECFKKALKLNPEDSDILTRIGVCYLHSLKTDDAISYFDKAFKSSNNNPRPLLNKAKIYTKFKQWDKAEMLFDEVYNILGDNFDYFLEKGCYYMFKNQFDDAKQSFDSALKIKPNSFQVVVLKYLSLYELGVTEEYELFKACLSKLELSFVENIEKFLSVM